MTVQANTALARKLSAGQEGLPEPPRSILRALRLGLARAAGEGIGLTLSVIGAKQARRPQPELADRVQDGWLLLLFTSEHAGAAAVCLAPGCVSAIVQQQTVGMVSAEPPSGRAFTGTDAAMAAPLLEDMLGRARGLVEGPADVASLSGYEYASRADDVRTLMLAMAEDSYRVIDLTVELAGGARQAEMCILLPDPPLTEPDQAGPETGSGRNLDQASGVMRAELTAVLGRMSLPLTNLSDLTVGDVLPLSGSKLDKVEVVSIDRARMAIGRLGQCGGMRAVRVNEHQPATALTYTEPQPFLATPSGSPDTLDAPPLQAMGEVMEDPTLPENAIGAGNLLPIDSVQMVSEISQLAGLPETDEDL